MQIHDDPGQAFAPQRMSTPSATVTHQPQAIVSDRDNYQNNQVMLY